MVTSKIKTAENQRSEQIHGAGGGKITTLQYQHF
nr:MAG TPA: hypothetical protein [Caudoviricetes sp.]